MSGEMVLLPTPNWFISRPIDVFERDRTVALSVINSIVVTTDLFGSLAFSIKDAHAKRINALAFYQASGESAPESDDKLLATCSEDLEVKVWNLRDRSVFAQHQLHQNAPTCLDWLSGSSTPSFFLISGDNKGNIFKWSPISNTHARFFPENKAITQIKVCRQSSLVAVGYAQGAIVVFEGDQMKTLFKFKSHEEAVNCLCWSPRWPNSSTAAASNETEKLVGLLEVDADELPFVLCSSSDDKTIRFWSARSGKQLKCVNAPGQASSTLSTRSKTKQPQPTKISFTPLCWPEPCCLVSGTYSGELVALELSPTELESSTSRVDQAVFNGRWAKFESDKSEQLHKKIIYDITWTGSSLITLSLDKLINVWNVPSRKLDYSISTLNGYVYSLTSSPIDPTLIALSVGDSTIKFLNESETSQRFVRFFSNSQIKSEITQICWHPIKESIVAFGTKDGRVGIADVMAASKPIQFIYTNYSQSIYTLIWAMPIIKPSSLAQSADKTPAKAPGKNVRPDSSTAYSLYSISDGKIVQHNMKLAANWANAGIACESVQLYHELNKMLGVDESASKTSLTELSFLDVEAATTEEGGKLSSRLFAIGKIDGSVEFYASHSDASAATVNRLMTFFNHQKLVTCMKWNRTKLDMKDLELDAGGPSLLLASGSNDFNVVVVDFKAVLKELIETKSFRLDENFDIKLFNKYKHKLVGHRERITCLNWSPNKETNILVSSCYDTTVQVWNADSGTPIANYRGHCDKVICCLFSNVDPNVVYSGGEDYSLHKWRVSEQSFQIPPEKCSILIGKAKNKQIKKQQKTAGSAKFAVHQNGKDQSDKENIQMKTEPVNGNGHCEIELVMEVETKQTNGLSNGTASEPMDTGAGEQARLVESRASNVSLNTSVSRVTPSVLHRDTKSIFKLSSNSNKTLLNKLEDCSCLFDVLYVDNKIRERGDQIDEFSFDRIPRERLNLCLYVNRAAALRLVNAEQAELRSAQSDKAYIFDVWKGDLAKLVDQLDEQENLTDFHLNLYQLSRGASEDTKALVCKQIEKLVKSSAVAGKGSGVSSKQHHQTINHHLESVNKAAMYALALYEPRRAVSIFLENNYHQYALCLANMRLRHDDELLLRTLNAYADYSIGNGDYETAILCYLRLKRVDECLRLLMRRDPAKNGPEYTQLFNTLFERFQQAL